MKDQTFSGNIRKFGEDMHKFQQHDGPSPSNAKYNYQKENTDKETDAFSAAKMTNCGKAGHVKTIVSSLQDVSAFHSPNTTPVMGRKLPGMRSPTLQKERKLVKQSSLQHPPGAYRGMN